MLRPRAQEFGDVAVGGGRFGRRPQQPAASRSGPDAGDQRGQAARGVESRRQRSRWAGPQRRGRGAGRRRRLGDRGGGRRAATRRFVAGGPAAQLELAATEAKPTPASPRLGGGGEGSRAAEFGRRRSAVRELDLAGEHLGQQVLPLDQPQMARVDAGTADEHVAAQVTAEHDAVAQAVGVAEAEHLGLAARVSDADAQVANDRGEGFGEASARGEDGGGQVGVDVLALPDQARVPGLGGGVGEHDVTQRVGADVQGAGAVAVEQESGSASAN